MGRGVVRSYRDGETKVRWREEIDDLGVRFLSSDLGRRVSKNWPTSPSIYLTRELEKDSSTMRVL